jgi:hypothetical protein
VENRVPRTKRGQAIGVLTPLAPPARRSDSGRGNVNAGQAGEQEIDNANHRNQASRSVWNGRIGNVVDLDGTTCGGSVRDAMLRRQDPALTLLC